MSRWAKAAQTEGMAGVARVIDAAVRTHFEHASAIGTIGIDRRSHRDVVLLLDEVLSERCNVPIDMVDELVALLRVMTNDDGFYEHGAFVNRTERRASLRSFWNDLFRHAASNPPIGRELADAHCRDTISWRRDSARNKKSIFFFANRCRFAVPRAHC